MNGQKNNSYAVTHKESYKSEYYAWIAMKSRCYGFSKGSYLYYKKRGIQVCKRWLHSYKNFLNDMGRKPASNYSLDRINVNGNYSPSNCRWARFKQIKVPTLWKRINAGWPMDRVLTKSIGNQGKYNAKN